MAATETRWLTNDTAIIDLSFQSVPKVFAAYLLETSDGLALIETGPTSTVAALEAGVEALGREMDDIRHLLVTHIHLDHAGAAGLLMQRNPQTRLFVHEIGAPHVIDPTNLVLSATRIYGDRMDQLWGEVLPVPADRVVAVSDGGTIDLGDRRVSVIYTPGHASHHVAFHDLRTNMTVVGDVAGIRIPPSPDVLPPTPPPDINVEHWHESVERLRKLAPLRMLLSHFGVVNDVQDHLALLDRRLDEWTALIESFVADGLDRDTMADRLMAHVMGQMVADGTTSLAQQTALASPYGMSVDGLLRYLRKRGG
ncbi:MAG TPA: MBL fold metallo-hydrolase [Thermomicrobiales bacterium]|nr:MBL fold metallo-hydrolase [Thermomicrobiales bacterium]